jgi:hypothetical protein
MTRVAITHEKSGDIITISKPFYCDINLISDSSLYEDPDLKKKVTLYGMKNETKWYKFKNTVILNEE